MDTSAVVYALIGGGLIGVASGAFLMLNGRIAGISGVLGGVLQPKAGDTSWRIAFLAGLVAGGVGLALLYPAAYPASLDSSYAMLIAAGVCVGFGTRLGSGCTSGHGVCGMARMSPRSIVATGTFIVTGAITVVLATRVFGA
ncbi:MAG TPA: YeeE/YedE family protein [Kofleriaceae bacterium]|nr:YeeE/YedE family protein [Kofleriaceae bacterium]